MGCGSSSAKKINKKFDQFEAKQETKIIYLQDQRIAVNLPQYNVGDYFVVEIPNKEYYYFENRFKELVSKEITHHRANIKFDSKEAFIKSIFNNDILRKHVIKVIRRKGIMHSYRWETWYLIATLDNSHRIDTAFIEKRKELYKLLNEKYDFEAEDIINKDVLRTERHKDLFSDIHGIGNKQLYRVCKAVGLFFPASSYVQGMNFIAAFVLQVNGLDEFEAFNFIISLWKKKKNLFYGIYQPHFPVLYFMNYAFLQTLKNESPKIYNTINKLQLPSELWVIKWFLSFFTYALEKEYVLRIFDFITINDVFGPVYVALAICEQLNNVFATEDLHLIAKLVQDKEELSSKVKFHRFVKTLKTLHFEKKHKIKLLNDYHKSLNQTEKEYFEPFYQKFHSHWINNAPEFYDDFDFDVDCDDYDRIGVDKLNLMLSSERVLNMYRQEISNIKKKTTLKEQNPYKNQVKPVNSYVNLAN